MTNEVTKLKLIGQNIARIRKNRNYSQNELAELLDISREHLAKIETAKRRISLKLLFKISEILNVSEKEIFDY